MGSSGRTRGPPGEAAGAPRPGSAPPPELSPAPRLRAHKMDQATVRRAGCKYLKSLSRAGGNGFRSRNVCREKRGRAMRVLCCEMGKLFLFLPPIPPWSGVGCRFRLPDFPPSVLCRRVPR